MTKQEINIAIAESDNWKSVHALPLAPPRGKDPEDGVIDYIPDYTSSYDAIQSVVAKLRGEQFVAFCHALYCLLEDDFVMEGDYGLYEVLEPVEIMGYAVIKATPEQLCRAYLRAIKE